MDGIPLEECEGVKNMLEALLNPSEDQQELNKEMAQIVEENLWNLI